MPGRPSRIALRSIRACAARSAHALSWREDGAAGYNWTVERFGRYAWITKTAVEGNLKVTFTFKT